eukprot:15145664-Alexandrium_andersonii.AAC.1
MAELCDWVVGCACANHACHNGLKWSLLKHSEDSEVLKDFHIVVEAVRNGFDLLHKHLRAFVLKTMDFSQDPHDHFEVFNFWVNLGVDPDTAELLAELNLRWDGERLLAHA